MGIFTSELNCKLKITLFYKTIIILIINNNEPLPTLAFLNVLVIYTSIRY